MKKIVVFTGYYYPRVGGSIYHIHEVFTRLSAQKYDVDLVTFNSEKVCSHETIDGIAVQRLPSLSILDDNFEIPLLSSGFFDMMYRLFTRRYDVVVTFTRFHFTSLIGVFLAGVRHIPHIHVELGSSHSVLPNPFFYHLSRFYDHTMGTMILRHADAVICTCGATEDFLHHLGAKDNIILSSSGIDFDMFSRKTGDSSLKHRFGDESRIITAISRLIYAKGIQDLIAAFPLIKVRCPDAKLLIAGDGPLKPELVEMVDERYKFDIIFLGMLTHREIPALLSITDVLVNPSYSEALTSYPVIEAGAMGIPSVTTDVGGTREIIEDNVTGLLVKPHDIAAIAEKTCSLLKDAELMSTLGKNVEAVIRSRFDWDLIARQHIDIIESLGGQT